MSSRRFIPFAATCAAVVLVVLVSGCGDDSPTVPARHETWLHVSPTGLTAGAGTADDPMLLPAAALVRAGEGGYRGVRFAAGLYEWQSPGDRMHFSGGVDIIGGCDPETWLPLPGARSEIRNLNGPALATGITVPTRISGLVLVGGPTYGGNPSSVTLTLAACDSQLVFTDCRFVAQDGYSFALSGSDGSAARPSEPAPVSAEGACDGTVPPEGALPAWGPGCGGGRGGDGGAPGEPGGAGLVSCFSLDPGGAGGEVGQDGADGQDGSDGRRGEHSTPAPFPGYVFEGTVVVANVDWGETGREGLGGTGGGGGGGADGTVGTGNAGGTGGAGGDGGGGGGGGHCGGHAVAVLALDTAARFVACEFVAGDGGDGSNGGAGAAGGTGLPGAPGGQACAGTVGRGGHGGHGGDGGAGGGGAGGNGGSSYGILAFGAMAPTWDATSTFTLGAAGSAGLGGLHGDGADSAPAGVAGESLMFRQDAPVSARR